MKKKLVFMMSMLALLGVLYACSNDDIDNDTVKKAQAHLIGKWRLISDLESENNPSTDFIEFCENSMVLFEYDVGTDNYRIVESLFLFEDNWSFSNGVFSGISGSIQLSRGLFYDSSQRLYCHIIYDYRLRVTSAEREHKDYIRVQ